MNGASRRVIDGQAQIMTVHVTWDRHKWTGT